MNWMIVEKKKYKKILEKFFELFLIKNTTANDGSYQVQFYKSHILFGDIT